MINLSQYFVYQYRDYDYKQYYYNYLNLNSMTLIQIETRYNIIMTNYLRSRY